MGDEIVPEVHPDPADYWSLAPEWKRLLGQAGETNPFLTPQWVGLSYEYFPKGECVLLSLRVGKKLVGIAPLSMVLRDQVPLIRFAVDSRLTDYADLILAHEHRTKALAKLIETLKDLALGKEFAVCLEPVRGDSPNLLLLERGLGIKASVSSKRLYLHLPDTVDEFLYRVMPSAARKALFKKTDRLLRSNDLEIEVLSSPLEISENLDDLLWMFVSESPEKRSFMTPEREAFLREVLPLVAREGVSRLFYLRVDGLRAAGHLVFETGTGLLVYMSGESATHQSLSPGVLLLKSVIENAIERGFKMVDFGRGSEAYKKGFGAKESKVFRLAVGDVALEPGDKPENLL